MDDMKDKFKGFMKKVNTQLSSSSSGKFKGQGRVLGGSSSASSGSNNPIGSRYYQPDNPKPTPTPSSLNSSSNFKSLPQKTPNSDQNKPAPINNSIPNRKPVDGFDPFDSLITTGKRSQNGSSLNVYECPICGQSYKSEEEVSMHVESCANNNSNDLVDEGNGIGASSGSELQSSVGAYLSGKPPEGSVEVVLRLFRNIVKEPGNAKFRKIRMGNPKIREAVSDVAGGVELLEGVGFELKEEGGEMCAVMEVPNEERLRLINEAIRLLEPTKVEGQVQKIEEKSSVAPSGTGEPVEPKKIDREVCETSTSISFVKFLTFVPGTIIPYFGQFL